MGISEHAETFCGKRVREYANGTRITDPQTTVYRIMGDWDAFKADPKFGQIEELVLGVFALGGADAVQMLVAEAPRLPNLRAIFFGDVTYEECEISWIEQTDLSPLLAAFPRLEQLRVRGANGLAFSSPRHDCLKTLILETGGMDRSVVEQLSKARFPALEHLELWLGEENYGANVRPADLAPILSGELFPNLSYLGLCNSCIADDLAAAVADAPILERLEVLDLSKGNLSDAGAEALLQFPLVARLKKLDIRHHYVSEACLARMEQAGITLDASEFGEGTYDEDGDYRMIYCSE